MIVRTNGGTCPIVRRARSSAQAAVMPANAAKLVAAGPLNCGCNHPHLPPHIKLDAWRFLIKHLPPPPDDHCCTFVIPDMGLES
jgi:hypothetical protein